MTEMLGILARFIGAIAVYFLIVGVIIALIIRFKNRRFPKNQMPGLNGLEEIDDTLYSDGSTEG